MAEYVSKKCLEYTAGCYFCSSSVRPNCIRAASKRNPDLNHCCLHCSDIEKCQRENTSKTKPCTMDIVGADEYCPYAI